MKRGACVAHTLRISVLQNELCVGVQKRRDVDWWNKTAKDPKNTFQALEIHPSVFRHGRPALAALDSLVTNIVLQESFIWALSTAGQEAGGVRKFLPFLPRTAENHASH